MRQSFPLKFDFKSISDLISVLLFLMLTGFLLSGCNQIKKHTQSDLKRMPEFKEPYKSIARDFYDIIFLQDGYPGKYDLENDTLFAHPIYGSYVINHYFDRYMNGEDSLKPYIHIVAHAALKRMTQKEGALIFYYPEFMPKLKLSGLTQSRYLVQFAKLYNEFGNSEYKEAANKLFMSFKIDINNGGFMNRFKYGISIEEYPEKPASYILNGWLTALVNLHEYSRLSNSKEAYDLFLESSHTLARVLQFYDYPQQKNSLYKQTGYQMIRMRIQGIDRAELVDAKTIWPGLDTFSFHIGNLNNETRHLPIIFEKDLEMDSDRKYFSEQIRLNVLVNEFSFPDLNVLQLHLKAHSNYMLYLDYGIGELDPTTTFPIFKDWVTLSKFKIDNLDTILNLPLNPEYLTNSKVPTKFDKVINGKYYNVYHFMHITRLEELYRITQIETFREWALKWRTYLEEWEEVKELQENNKIELHAIPK